jgi:hypothetical protein
VSAQALIVRRSRRFKVCANLTATPQESLGVPRTLLKFTFPFGEGGPLAVDEVCASLFIGANLICLLLFAARQRSTGQGTCP